MPAHGLRLFHNEYQRPQVDFTTRFIALLWHSTRGNTELYRAFLISYLEKWWLDERPFSFFYDTGNVNLLFSPLQLCGF